MANSTCFETGKPDVFSNGLALLREPTHGARKRIGPIKDSAIEWVSLESIEIVMAPGSGGTSPIYFRIVLGDVSMFGQPLAKVS